MMELEDLWFGKMWLKTWQAAALLCQHHISFGALSYAKTNHITTTF